MNNELPSNSPDPGNEHPLASVTPEYGATPPVEDDQRPGYWPDGQPDAAALVHQTPEHDAAAPAAHDEHGPGYWPDGQKDDGPAPLHEQTPEYDAAKYNGTEPRDDPRRWPDGQEASQDHAA